jgi:surface protein
LVTSLFIQNKHQDTLNSVIGSSNSYKIATKVTPTKTFVNDESIIGKTVGIRNIAGVEEVPYVFTRELAADESLAIDVTEDATNGFVILSDKVQDDANRKKSAADITDTEQSPSLRQFKNLAIAKWVLPQTEIRLNQETHNSALSDTSSIISVIAEEANFQSKPSHDHHKEQHQESSNEPLDLTLVVTSSVLSNIIVSRANPQSTSSVDHHAELLPAEDASFIVSSIVNECFLSKVELKRAVDNYMTQDCANLTDCNVGQNYGWPMNAWCVSNVTDMSWLFYSMSYFNKNISSWDVSNVVNMDYMFYYAQAFNDDLSRWDVSNVVNMYSPPTPKCRRGFQEIFLQAHS